MATSVKMRDPNARSDRWRQPTSLNPALERDNGSRVTRMGLFFAFWALVYCFLIIEPGTSE
jgi:hypothetical protein